MTLEYIMLFVILCLYLLFNGLYTEDTFSCQYEHPRFPIIKVTRGIVLRAVFTHSILQLGRVHVHPVPLPAVSGITHTSHNQRVKLIFTFSHITFPTEALSTPTFYKRLKRYICFCFYNAKLISYKYRCQLHKLVYRQTGKVTKKELCLCYEYFLARFLSRQVT